MFKKIITDTVKLFFFNCVINRHIEQILFVLPGSSYRKNDMPVIVVGPVVILQLYSQYYVEITY